VGRQAEEKGRLTSCRTGRARGLQKKDGPSMLICSLLARLNVQSSCLPCYAARQPALLCRQPARQPFENSCFSIGNVALQPAQPLFSVIFLIRFYLFQSKFCRFIHTHGPYHKGLVNLNKNIKMVIHNTFQSRC